MPQEARAIRLSRWCHAILRKARRPPVIAPRPATGRDRKLNNPRFGWTMRRARSSRDTISNCYQPIPASPASPTNGCPVPGNIRSSTGVRNGAPPTPWVPGRMPNDDLAGRELLPCYIENIDPATHRVARILQMAAQEHRSTSVQLVWPRGGRRDPQATRPGAVERSLQARRRQSLGPCCSQ